MSEQTVELKETHWRGPYDCWIPNEFDYVPAADGRNLMYKNGTCTTEFVGDPTNESEWCAFYAYNEGDLWFYDCSAMNDQEEQMLLCYTCQEKKGTHRCKACQVARYCCEQHQKDDWRRHKSECFRLPDDIAQDPANLLLLDALEMNLFNTFQKTNPVADGDTIWKGRHLLLHALVLRILANPVDAAVRDSDSEDAKLSASRMREGLALIKRWEKPWDALAPDPSATFWRKWIWPIIPLTLQREIRELYDQIEVETM